jgi:hypothetical protein
VALALLVHLVGGPRRAAPSANWSAYAALLLCLAMTALFTSARLVRIVESRSDGPLRDHLAGAVHQIHTVATAAGFDRPALWVDRALGRTDVSAAIPGQVAAVGPARPAPPALVTPAPALGATPSTLASPTSPAATAPPAPPAPEAVAGPTAHPSDAESVGAATAEATPSPESPATTPAEPAPLAHRTISPEGPLRVHVAGDSFAEWLGYEMARYGSVTGLLTSQLDFRLSTGLSNPTLFSWPGQLAQTMAGSTPPEAVVLFLGANDFNNMRTPAGIVVVQTPAWEAEYTRRAGEIMDVVGPGGARLYWVGMPVLRDGRRNAVGIAGNAAVMAAAASRPWVRFVDIGPLFADPDGRFATFRPGSAGEMTRVRQDDGIHLTRTATNWVAAQVYQELQRDWGLSPL